MTYDLLIRQTSDMIESAIKEASLPPVDYSVIPAREGFGDASSNVAFLLARQLRQSPAVVARTLVTACKTGGVIDSVEAHASGYVNVSAKWDLLARAILEGSHQPQYGSGPTVSSKVTIEHTSVNPNKALHIGHIRNVVIGDALSNILRKRGHTVHVLNYVDDSGLQVADMVLGFTRLGFSTTPPDGQKFDEYCGDTVYVQTTSMCEGDQSLQEERRRILRRIEEGNNEDAAMAESVTGRVLAAQLETCWRLGARYDLLNYESQIVRSGLWGRTFEMMKDAGITRLEDAGPNAGCWMVDDKVLVRSNGTATYMAKDIPYAAWKLGLVDNPFKYVPYPGQEGHPLYRSTLDDGQSRHYSADTVITVIDARQSSLQKMVSDVLFGLHHRRDSYIHLAYEPVTLSARTAKGLGLDEKPAQMSGRKGLYVRADTVYDTVRRRAAEETRRRNPDMDDNAVYVISHNLSVGTIRYEMIKQDLSRPIVFDLEKSTSLDGDTAPYLMYSYVRARRILQKADSEPDYSDIAPLSYSDQERSLLRLLGTYETVVSDAATNLSAKVVARYCHDLAVSFNGFYESHRVMGAGGDTQNVRLCMVDAFCTIMHDALALLGICTPERM